MEKLVNLARGRECFVGLSVLFVYDRRLGEGEQQPGVSLYLQGSITRTSARPRPPSPLPLTRTQSPPRQQPPPGSLHYETYIKSQLLSNLYLQQYMTNNLANIGQLGAAAAAGVGGDLLSVTAAAAAAAGAVTAPLPSVTLTAVQGRSRPRRLAAAVVENGSSAASNSSNSCPSGPLDLSTRLEAPAAATDASAPMPTANNLPAPPAAHARTPKAAGSSFRRGGGTPVAEAALNLSAAILPKATTLTGGSKGLADSSREAESPSPPSAAAAVVPSNVCPICGQVFTQQDRYSPTSCRIIWFYCNFFS